MYSPDIFPKHLYSLWNDKPNKTPIKSLEQETTKSNHQQNNTTNGLLTRSLEAEHQNQRKQLRTLFSPPLSAYSADYPGASLSQLEYTIQTLATSTSHNLFQSRLLISATPLAQSKIDQLERIRNTGYNSIRPIGIGRTLEELDFENANTAGAGHFGEVSQEITFSNLAAAAAAENTNEQLSALWTSGINTSGTREEGGAAGPEIDLDAQVFNADEFSDDGVNDEAFTDDSDEVLDAQENGLRRREGDTDLESYRTNIDDEDFMAAEVEYQDDHSINSEINTGTYMLMNSGTNTTSTAFNSNTTTGRTANTSPTTASGILPGAASSYNMSRIHEQGEIQDENEPEYSELDMIVDE